MKIDRIRLDIDKKLAGVIPSVQWDNNTRYLHINVLNGTEAFNLSGYSVKVAGLKPDGTSFFNDVRVINAREGFIEVVLTEQMNAAAGSVRCELKLYNYQGVLSTQPFIIYVETSVTPKGIVSSNEFKALTDALIKVGSIDTKFETLTAETVKAATEKEIQKQIASGNMTNLTIANGTITGEKIANGTITGAKIADNAIMRGNIHPICTEEINGIHFESNRAGTVDYLEVVYDLEGLGIDSGNISLVLEYGFSGFNTPVTTVDILVDRNNSLTTSSGYVYSYHNAINNGEIRNTNITFNSSKTGRYLHILYGIAKPRDFLLVGDLFYSKVVGNGVNIENIVNVYIYAGGNHQLVKHHKQNPEQLVTFKALEKKLGGDGVLVTTEQIKDNAVTYNKLDSNLIMPMETIKQVYIEGKYGGSYDKGIWGDIHFNIDKSKLAVGKKLKFTFAIVLEDINFDGMNMVTWHGTATPNSGHHVSWFNSGKVFDKITLGKTMIVEREESITQSMYNALMVEGREYRICPVPYIKDITQTNSYRVWDINIYIDGEKIDSEITSIQAINGSSLSANFVGTFTDGYKANTLVGSNYPNIIEEKLYNLSKKVIPPKFYNKNGITFGDSITEGTEGGYIKYIKEILQCNLTNKGSSGAATGRLVGIMTHIKDRDAHSSQTTPDYTDIGFVTIMIGTNGGVGNSTFNDIPMIIGNTVLDLPFLYNGTTINTEDEYWALFPNKFYSNVALCIEYVQAKNPNTRIFLITPPITKQLGLTYECGIKKVRQAMLEIGEHYGVPVIDAQVNAGIGLHNIYKCTTDGTHLNTFGNKLWGTYVGEQMLIK